MAREVRAATEPGTGLRARADLLGVLQHQQRHPRAGDGFQLRGVGVDDQRPGTSVPHPRGDDRAFGVLRSVRPAHARGDCDPNRHAFTRSVPDLLACALGQCEPVELRFYGRVRAAAVHRLRRRAVVRAVLARRGARRSDASPLMPYLLAGRPLGAVRRGSR